MSKWFGLTVVGGIGIGLFFIGWSMMHKVTPRASAPPMHEGGYAPNWFAKYKPIAEATPAPLHFAASPYHPLDSPPPMTQQAYPTAKASPGISEWERMRQREFIAALGSDIGVKGDNGQTLETTPRVIVATPANSTLSITTQPAAPHTIGAWTWIYANPHNRGRFRSSR